jgi:hypothetical protein
MTIPLHKLPYPHKKDRGGGRLQGEDLERFGGALGVMEGNARNVVIDDGYK